LYTGLSTTGSPYIGNEVYPQGDNPFVEEVVLTIWQWCLVGLGGLLVLILVIVIICKCCCGKKGSDERRDSIAADHNIVYGTDGGETQALNP
jgi:hypothetical protein